MRRNRERHREIDASRTLDLLVLDVMKTLVRVPLDDAVPSEPPSGRPARPAAPPLAAPSSPAGPRSARGAPDRRTGREPDTSSRSLGGVPRNARIMADVPPAVEDHPPFEAEQLLDQEEEAFVTRTAEWLAQRSNPDELLAVIWTRVTEIDPDGFYQPEPPLTAPGETSEPNAEAPGTESKPAPPTNE
jgi:hypothetical protein